MTFYFICDKVNLYKGGVSIYNRLKIARKALNLSQKSFAAGLGIGVSSLGMMETGKRAIKERHINNICTTYNINEHWLRTGEGDMFNKPLDLFQNLKSKYNLSTADMDIIINYLEMDRKDRDVIVTVLKKLLIKRDE